MFLSVCLSVCPSLRPSVYLSVRATVRPSMSISLVFSLVYLKLNIFKFQCRVQQYITHTSFFIAMVCFLVFYITYITDSDISQNEANNENENKNDTPFDSFAFALKSTGE